MTPTNYRSGGANTEIRFAIGECSLGSILVAQSEHGICAILIGGDPEVLARDLQDRFPRANLSGGDDKFEQRVAKVVGFIEAPGIGLELPLDVRGTAFQQRVWQALREIPVGETLSYIEIARRIGAPAAVRAVAQACAANVLAVAIPCHRVVRNDGGLSVRLSLGCGTQARFAKEGGRHQEGTGAQDGRQESNCGESARMNIHTEPIAGSRRWGSRCAIGRGTRTSSPIVMAPVRSCRTRSMITIESICYQQPLR